MPFESIPKLINDKEILQQIEILNPTAVISRILKIQRGMNVFNDEQRTFPIFKETPDTDSLESALEKLKTKTYGIIDGDLVKVYESGNPDPISATNYSNQAK